MVGHAAYLPLCCGPVKGPVAHAVRDAGAVALKALRLLGRHWPMLVLLYLLGAALHHGILWFCIWLSEDHSTTAAFILPLVPMATLAALILMLRELTPALKHVGPPQVGRLNLLASALIPFLAVYVSQQYLKEDTRAFVNAAVSDELLERSGGLAESTFNVDRGNIATGAALAGIVVGALVIRWLLDRFDLPQRGAGWGLFAAYVEVLWVWILAKRLDNFVGDVEVWVRGRRLTHWLFDQWERLIDVLGPVGEPVRAVGSWFWGALGQADAIVVIPIAWLTVGAVVYGRKLEARRPAVSTPAAAPLGPEPRWRRAVERVPSPVRRAGSEATASVRGRFSALGNGIRLLAVAGLAPMLLFCLVFLLSRQVEYGVAELLRRLVGPLDFRDALTLDPYLSVISRGAYTVVLVVLLGAAIDRILGHLDGAAAPVVEPETSNSA